MWARSTPINSVRGSQLNSYQVQDQNHNQADERVGFFIARYHPDQYLFARLWPFWPCPAAVCCRKETTTQDNNVSKYIYPGQQKPTPQHERFKIYRVFCGSRVFCGPTENIHKQTETYQRNTCRENCRFGPGVSTHMRRLLLVLLVRHTSCVLL